jgi:hypothetical protein
MPSGTSRQPAAPRQAGAARALPPVRPSAAPVELILDLRATPPDKVLSRLLGALERISPDVTLIVLLRDTPEYAGVMAGIFQTLRGRGYLTDSSRFPPGGQRLRIRPGRARGGARGGAPEAEETGAPVTPLRELAPQELAAQELDPRELPAVAPAVAPVSPEPAPPEPAPPEPAPPESVLPESALPQSATQGALPAAPLRPADPQRPAGAGESGDGGRPAVVGQSDPPPGPRPADDPDASGGAIEGQR